MDTRKKKKMFRRRYTSAHFRLNASDNESQQLSTNGLQCILAINSPYNIYFEIISRKKSASGCQ